MCQLLSHNIAGTVLKAKIFLLSWIIFLLFAGHAGAQITYRGSAAISSQDDYTVLTKPAGVVAGDFILVHFGISGSDASAKAVLPTGWTEIRFIEDMFYLNSQYFYKIAGYNEPSTYSFDLNGSFYSVETAISAYGGVDTIHPIDVEDGTGSYAEVNSYSTPSINTTYPNEMIVVLFTSDYTGICAVFNNPSGMINCYNACDDNDGQSLSQRRVLQAVAGPTGAKTSSIGVSNCKVTAEILALIPANVTTGIKESALPYPVNVYPNPANQSTVISLQLAANKKVEVTITDMLGNKIHAQQIEPRNSNLDIEVDVSTFVPGIYFVKVLDGENTFLNKLVKQ
jgi:hypothetical protein